MIIMSSLAVALGSVQDLGVSRDGEDAVFFFLRILAPHVPWLGLRLVQVWPGLSEGVGMS